MADDKLTDREIYERLHNAIYALGKEDGQTTVGSTTLKTARQALVVLQMGMVKAEEGNLGHNPVIKSQDEL